MELRSYIRSDLGHNHDPIKISINTLTFVANHMCDDLANLPNTLNTISGK